MNFGTITGDIGIRLFAGGTVINGSAGSTAASIAGSDGDGVRIGIVPGTVTNFGTIAGDDRGIQLDFGGTITNGSSASTAASISGATLGGIYVSNLAGTVTNFGSIYGFFSGVRLDAGGILSNKASGWITASGQGLGVYVGGAAGTVTNLGTISGGNLGVGLAAGGTITNGSASAPAALIQSAAYGRGAVLGSAGGTLINFGSISGYYGVGVQFGGRVTNQLGASITGAGPGSRGIAVYGGAVAITNSGRVAGTTGVGLAGTATGTVTLTNSGTITGTGGIAVQLGAGNDRVIVQPGAVFNGAVLGGGGTDTVVFTNTGAISLAGFAGFENINLSSIGANILSLTNANFAGVTGASIKVFGGAAGNTVDASALSAPNRLVFTGGAGADSASGGAGNDRLTGGAGADAMTGGAGKDTLFINDASEIVAGETYQGGVGADTLNGNAVASAADLSAVTLGSLESLFGFSGGLTLTAAQLDAFTLAISTGAITLSGAGNVDISNANVSTATFNLSNAGNGLVLNDEGFIGYTVNGGSGADTVTLLSGSIGGFLNGNGGADTLTGGGVNDFLTGGAGNDTLTGGGSFDQFIYRAATGNGTDIITDFSGQTAFGGGAGEGDKFTFDDLLLVGTFDYRGSQAFTATGNTEARVVGNSVRIDTDGNGTANIAITVTGLTSASQLVTADFQFI